ncbi:na[+]/H[+] hydrogen exchanger 2 isoform X6 [Musca autumnalis]|uniref:na[+]/H[+] hydrogen exchanger 2 isoform X6 n=1 Tax=Musca autumnalis TaxID=221902 RepID=UPI003CEA141F
MFQDLFLRNSNEIFFRGPENGDDNANKQQQRAKDFVKSSPLPPSLQNQKQKSPKFTNTTTTSENMAVSKKIMESKMEQHKKAPLSLDKKKTSSLEQELNLARRACWCSSVSAGNGGGDDDEGDGLLDRKSINECCEKCFKSNDDNVNDDNDNDDIGQTTNLEKTTTVLNGAKIIFSKNINNTTTKTTNDNTMNSNKLAENSFSVKKPHEVAAATDGSDVIPTTTTTTNNLIKRKLNSKSQEHNKEEHDNDVDDDVNEDIVNKNSKLAASSSSTSSTSASASSLSKFKASIKALLLALWLGFVNFCERNTIKRNDPRFEIYRQKPETQMQQSTTTASSSANDPKADKRKPFQFKLLTSKKVIFLLLVCFFFSCIQRIDARPNTAAGGSGADGNAVTGQAVGVGAESVYTVTPGKVNSLPASNTALPPESVNSNAIKQPKSTDGGGSEAPQSAGTTGNDIKLNTDSSSGRPAVAVPHSDDDDNDHGDDDGGHSGGHERYPLAQVEFDRVKTPFIIGVWILSASIAKIGFHMTPKLHLIFPESCLLIVVGVVIGVVLFFCTDVAVSPLTPNTFFFYMLPPIILDAGYFMPNRLFFDNLGTILLMAVVGTIFNIATIGGSLWACGLTGIFGGPEDTPRFLDIFIFASLISAVDPVAVLAVFEEIHVNEILYIVVFGESLLNDAVTVVMYHMMEVYNHIGISEIIAQDVVNGVGSFFVVAVGGTVIGIIWGFLTGLVTRFTDHVRVIEPIFIFVMAYLAYLNAEIFHMSGILAITFCGITMKNYVESNISQKSHTTVKYALKMLSSSSETIIFMFLGVATVNNSHVWNTWFVILTIVFCSVFRVIGVIILSAMANRFRLHKLSRVDQFVMSYGGLRGAVAFALVLLIDETIVPQKNMFVTTTIAVIYFTVFVQGITIKPLVKILNVKRANKRKPTMNERIHERFMDHLMAGIEDIVGKTGNYNVRDKFKRFDNRFIRPLLLRDLKGAEPKIIETYSKLTMRDAIEVMRRNPSTIGQITGTESMSALFRNYTNNCIGGRWAPPTIYTTCPSLTNLDNTCSRNLDMHELDYNPSKKDLTDAKIHHLLAEELKPYRRHRRLSYSRHAVDDRDLSTQVNYKMQMNFRRMFNDRKHHKRSKRGANKDGVKQNHVSFHDFQQNGTTKQFSHAEENPNNKLTEVTVVGENDDWEDGLTFTAKSSPDSDRANNNSLIAHIQNLPGFDASKARIVQHYATPSSSSGAREQQPTYSGSESPEKLLSPDPPIGPTAAELILPWRRDRSYQSIAEHAIPEEDRNLSRDSDGERRVATPTATESQLPWKRQGDEVSDAVQQNEFPAWASNKEYLAYNSPSATFLGGINKPKQPKSVIGLFRRESSGSRGGVGGSIITVDGTDGGSSARGSDPALAAALSQMVVPSSTIPYNPRLDKRSQSISSGSGSAGIGDSGHSGPFPVTASHRRNVRRGSMLELTGDTIPEESYHHGYSKSLCEPAGEEWEAMLAEAERADHASTNSEKLLRSGREPLLPRLTPRAQIRRGLGVPTSGGPGVGSASSSALSSGGNKRSHVTTALLSTSTSDYDDDNDEDFDLYDDENIVVTTISNDPMAHRRDQRGGGGATGSGSDGEASSATTSTTTIRLTRNNDESII